MSSQQRRALIAYSSLQVEKRWLICPKDRTGRASLTCQYETPESSFSLPLAGGALADLPPSVPQAFGYQLRQTLAPKFSQCDLRQAAAVSLPALKHQDQTRGEQRRNTME
ncbi:unnamed protein product [Caretta caretta]